MSSPPQVAVIGGGYAGFAAAVTLARGGARVSLFESSRTLGGRARVVESDGYRIDNGQHILLGAYAETLRMLRLVGVKPRSLLTRRLTLVYPGLCALRAAPLPAPLHLAFGLLRARGFSWTDKRAMARLMGQLKSQAYRIDPDPRSHNEFKAVLKGAPPAPGTARVQTLAGRDYVRVWANHGGTSYIVHLAVKP